MMGNVNEHPAAAERHREKKTQHTQKVNMLSTPLQRRRQLQSTHKQKQSAPTTVARPRHLTRQQILARQRVCLRTRQQQRARQQKHARQQKQMTTAATQQITRSRPRPQRTRTQVQQALYTARARRASNAARAKKSPLISTHSNTNTNTNTNTHTPKSSKPPSPKSTRVPTPKPPSPRLSLAPSSPPPKSSKPIPIPLSPQRYRQMYGGEEKKRRIPPSPSPPPRRVAHHQPTANLDQLDTKHSPKFIAEVNPRTRAYIVVCSHCGDSFLIHESDINCHIFRHGGLYGKDGKIIQIPAHASREECMAFFTKHPTASGCGGPMRVTKLYDEELVDVVTIVDGQRVVTQKLIKVQKRISIQSCDYI